MEITWFGHSCFRLTERGLAAVVTDPYDDSLGYPTLRLKAATGQLNDQDIEKVNTALAR